MRPGLGAGYNLPHAHIPRAALDGRDTHTVHVRTTLDLAQTWIALRRLNRGGGVEETLAEHKHANPGAYNGVVSVSVWEMQQW
jgi:hypothetical protein